MTNAVKDVINLFWEPVLNVWDMFATYAPGIIAAFIFVLVGLFLARFLSTWLEQFLRRIKLDLYTSKVGINEILTRFGLGKSPSRVLSFILYWTLLLVFFVTATNILNLSVVSQVLEQFLVGFLPKITAAVIIAFGGLLFANFISSIIENAARANSLKGGTSLGKIAHFVVICFTLVVVLEQFGLRMKLIENGAAIILSALGLGFAIAVGLGAKDFAHDMIKSLFTEDEKEK
ncbi:MAG: hypothetical protein J6Z08_01825 [Elusimicrobiales bacterium]|jgi:hypothetical protein|nr:hypothetical protein [Elusimicrobiales bacterium]